MSNESNLSPLEVGKGRMIKEGHSVALINLGARLEACKEALDILSPQGCKPTLMDARFAKPLDTSLLDQIFNNHELGALVVLDAQTGAVIGSSRYQGLEKADGGSVEIGWTFLARSHWGGTFNHAMKRLMLAHALASVAECRFLVGETNTRSGAEKKRQQVSYDTHIAPLAIRLLPSPPNRWSNNPRHFNHPRFGCHALWTQGGHSTAPGPEGSDLRKVPNPALPVDPAPSSIQE
jgi:hypothetical protein